MNSFPLSPGQQSIWFGQQTQPNSPRYQCAELLRFTDPVNITLLSECIAERLSAFAVFQACYDNPQIAQIVPNAISIEHLELSAAHVHDFARRAVIDVDSTTLMGETLTKHWLIRIDDGSVAWIARFHHITGDGFAFHALISDIAACYSARITGQPTPETKLTIQPRYAPSPAAAPVEVTDFWSSQSYIAPPSIFCSDSSDDLVVTATATATAPNYTVLAGITAYYVATLTGMKDRVTLGLPLMNRPVGQTTIDLSPTVLVVPYTIDLTDPVNNAHKSLAQVRAHAAISETELRHAVGFNTNYGPHLNFRPFTPRFTFGSATATLETLSVGPINDCEFIYQTRTDGKLDIIVMTYGSNRSTEVHQHATRLKHLIDRVAAGTELVGLSIATPEELQTIAAWNATDHPLSASRLSELIARTRKQLDPNTPLLGAWVDGKFHWHDAQWVFTQIEHRAQRLRKHGLGLGDVIAVRLERSLEFLLTIAAIATIDAAFCPIDPALPVQRQEHMLTAARVSAVVGASISTMPGGTVPPECAYVLFTSGSTGAPKAVAVSHLGIVNRLAWMCDYYNIGSTDRILHKTPSSFDVSVWEYLLAVCHGIPTAIASPSAHRNPEELLQQMYAGRITLCHFVPAALKAFLAYYHKRAQAPTNLRAIICSGEALSSELAHRCRATLNVAVHNLYGPAEAAIDVTAYTVQGAESTIPIGKPVWNTRIDIVDSHGALLPPGVPGTLEIVGCQVGLGYLDQPELTAQRFSGPPPRYNTGDQALWLDGHLYYLGREDSQVKIRGQRLELAEVESVLNTLPGVEQTAVILHKLAGEPALIAYLVGTATAESVTAQLATQLPDYMIPTAILTVPELPTTINGKLDVSALPIPAPPPQSDTELTTTEQQVAQAFQQILGCTVTDPQANFFALGGTSLSAVNLALLFDDLSIAEIFAHPTVTGLATCLTNRKLHAAETIDQFITLATGEHDIPVWCIYPAGGLSWSYVGLIKYLPNRTIYGVQATGISDETQRADSISHAAEALCAEIHRRGYSQVALVGWSIGGIIAHEAACQLGTVTHLIVLDAYPAEIWRQLPAPSDAQLWQGVLAMAGITPTEPLDATIVEAAMRSRGGVFGELSTGTLTGIRTLIKHNAALMRTHHTKIYSGTMIHFTADQDQPTRDSRLTAAAWSAHCNRLITYHADVTHPGMVSDPVLARVAHLLLTCPSNHEEQG